MPGLRAGFLHFGVATLCLIFQPWDSMGRHGTKWDEHRSRGRGRAKIARIATIAKGHEEVRSGDPVIARDRVIEKPNPVHHRGH